MQISRSLGRCFAALAASVLLSSVQAADTPPKKPEPAPAKPAAAPTAPAHPATNGAEPAHAAQEHGAPGHAAQEHGTAPTAGTATTHGPTAGGGEQHITTSHVTTTTAKSSKEETGIAKDGPHSHGAPSTEPERHVAVSQIFHTPVPVGGHEVHTATGAAVRTRADGTRSDVHDAKRGMDIHHGLTGNRRVSVEQPNHTRIVAERGGHGYVQHPYNFHGKEFGQRTFYEHGRAYDRFYGRVPYGGGYLEVYAPARFYPVGFYGYAYAPWPAPVNYAWGWGGAPWYGYYGAYYVPYPVYPAPNYWLADFVIAASLAAAFEARVASADGTPLTVAPWLDESPLLSSTRWENTARWLADTLVTPAAADALSATPMSDAVKQAVAEELKAAVERERDQSQGAAKEDGAPAQNSIAQLLADNEPHVLVAGSDVDLTSSEGQECALSQGDVLKVAGPLSGGAETLAATILASKAGKECAVGGAVTVPVSDLQEMQNHMREQMDDGLAELQKTQGKHGLPAAPAGAAGAPVEAAFAASAPPPDPAVKTEIAQQVSAADQAEGEVVASIAAAPADATSASTGGAAAVGQPIAAVTAALGAPTKVIDLGAKKIYVYADQKVVTVNGVVDKVE